MTALKFLNILFVVLIVLSFVSYFYFKTKQFRTSLVAHKNWYKSKAGVSLAAFIILFGFNQALMFPDWITFLIAGLFVIIGAVLGVGSYRRVKHYGQFVEEEYELNKKK